MKCSSETLHQSATSEPNVVTLQVASSIIIIIIIVEPLTSQSFFEGTKDMKVAG
jgi:hypothetical protein